RLEHAVRERAQGLAAREQVGDTADLYFGRMPRERWRTDGIDRAVDAFDVLLSATLSASISRTHLEAGRQVRREKGAVSATAKSCHVQASAPVCLLRRRVRQASRSRRSRDARLMARSSAHPGR